jgi:ATP/maltotriose-dependent transcriptional regulator MalT
VATLARRRAFAADAREVAAQIRTLALGGRQRTDAMRASNTLKRLDVATVRLAAADQRGRSAWALRHPTAWTSEADKQEGDAQERDDAADTRDDAANERDVIADDRDAIAAARDAAADVRDEAADERDRVFDLSVSAGRVRGSGDGREGDRDDEALGQNLVLDCLTGREREVLGLIAEGRSNHAIGDLLRVETKTVEAHIASIFSKLELAPATADHRRVLAVLAHLRAPSWRTAARGDGSDDGEWVVAPGARLVLTA